MIRLVLGALLLAAPGNAQSAGGWLYGFISEDDVLSISADYPTQSICELALGQNRRRLERALSDAKDRLSSLRVAYEDATHRQDAALLVSIAPSITADDRSDSVARTGEAFEVQQRASREVQTGNLAVSEAISMLEAFNSGARCERR